MSKKLKRTLKDEHRVFNEEWELQYFVVSDNGKMQCLLCETTFATIKKYNAHQHYSTHKDNKHAKLEGESRSIALKKLKEGRQKQQQFFHRIIHQDKAVTEASYKVAYLLGKQGKPFSDSQLIKDCIIEVVGCLDPDKINKYKNIPLSRRTNTDRQQELAQNITEQLTNVMNKNTTYYSVALDESTDATDSAQVLYFVRAVTEEFEVYEELFALGTLKGRTRGIDVFNDFKEKFIEKSLNFANIVSVCTDGAPSMTGKNEGFVAHLKKEFVNQDFISFHCILHQQNLCSKSVILDDTLKNIVAIVNYIRANSTRHRHFREMLMLDEEIISADLPYHSKVRWLSQGQVLVKILSLREKIIQLYNENNQNCVLSDANFLQDTAFLCDIMAKQNELNVSLQGKNKSVFEMWQKIQVFRKKLSFFRSLLEKSNLSENYFPELAKLMNGRSDDTSECVVRYVTVLDNLIEEYNGRFKDFEKHEMTLKLAFQPHVLDFSEAPEKFQMELIELSEDNIVKAQFDNKEDPARIWKGATEYPRLREHARKLISCFCSTYLCESSFSYMRQIKNDLRTQITDVHLENQLKLKTSSLEPNISMLVQQKQPQKSH